MSKGPWGWSSGAVGGAAPAAFVPTDYTGCVMWLDAQDATSVTLESGKVAVWADKSLSGNSFRQTSAGSRPTYTSEQYVTFAGSNVNHLVGDIDYDWHNNDWLIFIVASCDAGFSGFGGLLGNRFTGSPTRWWTFGHDGNNSDIAIEYNDGSVNYISTSYDPDGTGVQRYMIMRTASSTRIDIFRNGISAASDTSVGDITDANAKLYIGRWFTSTQSWDGNVYGMVMYDNILDATKRAAVDTYLAGKYS